MFSATWTHAALSSEGRTLKGDCWRLVEAQHRVSTLKIVDTLAEQALLEELLEATKPTVPPECRKLHYLLATPFRYDAPYPRGSRFRRAGRSQGIYYAAEHVETAVAEISFHRLLFFAESPATPWPPNATEFTAFRIGYAGNGIDLTRAPLSRDRNAWTDPLDYSACQSLSDAAREAGLWVIRSESVRDPEARANIALLSCLAFTAREPRIRQTWRIRFGPVGVHALCEYPELKLEFSRDAFERDGRIADFDWDR